MNHMESTKFVKSTMFMDGIHICGVCHFYLFPAVLRKGSKSEKEELRNFKSDVSLKGHEKSITLKMCLLNSP